MKISNVIDEKAFNYASKRHPTKFTAGEIAKYYSDGFVDGVKWQNNNLWKPANGDDLPEIDREVIVFTQDFPNDAGIMKVAIAHRPNPNGWDGKNIATGEIEHYTPKTYDKGGWNIPDVKWWLDLDLPKIEE